VTTAISEIIVIFSSSRTLQFLLGSALFVQIAGNAIIGRRPFGNLLLGSLAHQGVFVASCGRRDLLTRCRRLQKPLGNPLKLAKDLRENSRFVACHLQRAKAGNRIRIIKIPLVFRDADKVTNGRIACPRFPQCGSRQFAGHTALQKSADVRAGTNRFNRWQTGQIRGFVGRRIDPGLCGGRFRRNQNCFFRLYRSSPLRPSELYSVDFRPNSGLRGIFLELDTV